MSAGTRWIGLGRGAMVVLVAALALGGSVPLLASRFLGVGAVDDPGTLWFHAQVLRALEGEPAALLLNDRLYFPWGQDLLRNAGANVLDGLLAAPFAIFGPVLGHNLFLLGVLAANGAAAAWVARREGCGPGGAAVVGVAFGLAPFPLYELVEGRPAQALLVFFVVTLEGFGRALTGRWPAWAVGVALAVLGLQYWYYAIFAGFMLVAWAVTISLRPRAGLSRRRIVSVLGTAFAVALVLVTPLALPLALALGRGEIPGIFQADEPSALLLHSFQPLLGIVGALDGDRLFGSQRALPFALGLAAAGAAWSRWRGGAPEGAQTSQKLSAGEGVTAAEVCMGAVVLVLATGPWIWAGGYLYAEPVYLLLTTLLPPLGRLWHPSRAVAGLAVLGIGWLARSPGVVRVAVCALGLIEAARDGLLPLPTWDASVPAGYQCLGVGEGALIELPFGVSQRHLWYETLHRRPVLGGFHEGALAFQPPEARVLREENLLLRGLLVAARGGPPGAPFAEDLASSSALRDLGYRYVILQKDELPSGESAPQRSRRRAVDAGLNAMLGQPIWDDARSRIWAPWGDPLPCAPSPPALDTVAGEPLRDRWVLNLGEWPAQRVGAEEKSAGAPRTP